MIAVPFRSPGRVGLRKTPSNPRRLNSAGGSRCKWKHNFIRMSTLTENQKNSRGKNGAMECNGDYFLYFQRVVLIMDWIIAHIRHKWFHELLTVVFGYFSGHWDRFACQIWSSLDSRSIISFWSGYEANERTIHSLEFLGVDLFSSSNRAWSTPRTLIWSASALCLLPCSGSYMKYTLTSLCYESLKVQ